MKLDKFGKQLSGLLALIFSHFGALGIGSLKFTNETRIITTTVACLLGAAVFGGLWLFTEEKQ